MKTQDSKTQQNKIATKTIHYPKYYHTTGNNNNNTNKKKKKKEKQKVINFYSLPLFFLWVFRLLFLPCSSFASLLHNIFVFFGFVFLFGSLVWSTSFMLNGKIQKAFNRYQQLATTTTTRTQEMWRKM